MLRSRRSRSLLHTQQPPAPAQSDAETDPHMDEKVRPISTISSGSGLSTSSSGETLASSVPQTLEDDEILALSQDQKPRVSSSYFITAMPNRNLPYCDPASPIDEVYPFESCRIPRISVDEPVDLARKSVLAKCQHCGKHAMTRVKYNAVTKRNVVLSVFAPFLAPCLLSSSTMNKFSKVEHFCECCGSSLSSQYDRSQNFDGVEDEECRFEKDNTRLAVSS